MVIVTNNKEIMSTISRRLFLPLKLLLLVFSYLFPRNRKIWCFGSSFSGNAKYLFIYMNEYFNRKYQCIWIGKSDDVNLVRSLGGIAYTTWSFKGLYYCLIGGAYIYNSFPANVNLYTMGGVKLVNLWHGVALKCINRQIKEGPSAKYYQSKGIINEIRYLNFRKHADVVLSTSPLMTENFSEAFDATDKEIIEGIYPRCYLFDKSKEEIAGFIGKYEGAQTQMLLNIILRFDYTYIYLPTWRDTGDDFISQCDFDFDKLNEIMKQHNRLFLMKMHPDSILKFDVDYSNIIIIDKQVDIYPLLPYTNCLITDFSSIYFDYLLLQDKQIILFVPDFDDYIRKSRALKYSYDDVMKGRKIVDFLSLVECLSEDNPCFEIPKLAEVRERFWNPQYTDMKQLIEGIDAKISN